MSFCELDLDRFWNLFSVVWITSSLDLVSPLTKMLFITYCPTSFAHIIPVFSLATVKRTPVWRGIWVEEWNCLNNKISTELKRNRKCEQFSVLPGLPPRFFSFLLTSTVLSPWPSALILLSPPLFSWPIDFWYYSHQEDVEEHVVMVHCWKRYSGYL